MNIQKTISSFELEQKNQQEQLATNNIDITLEQSFSKNKPLETFLKHACYPILMSAVALTIFCGFYFSIDFGLCNITFLFCTIIYLAICERFIPYKKEWHPNAKEWRRDGIYLFMTMMGGASSVAAIFYIASLVPPLDANIPLWLEIVLTLLLTSLGTYVFHRASHELPWLWRFHGIHHATHKVNVGNNALNHIFDVFGRRLLAQLPMALIGISPPALFVVSVFNIAQGYFSHANVDVKLGWLNYWVGSPEQHRLHHSVDITEAGHYSVDITIWDRLFNSYFWQPGRKPIEIGVRKPNTFPLSNDIFKNLIHPFRKKKYYSQVPEKNKFEWRFWPRLFVISSALITAALVMSLT
ncbi:sterol desaturase family protein [Aliikangiella sp. IMCC44359]|uniref:sterol desaturase family protein n=1 Tax=Aliikangiella sp. IMCC44359 TaxID=3459125 RepID=UPI00403AD896